jgi:PhzF family phenazine biosynthesis protein
MKKVQVYLVNSFSYQLKGGNPAGVVLDFENSLSDAQMQAIAREVGFSETAFVRSTPIADFELKFFTPTDEVPLCGHATIASFWLLNHLGYLTEGSYTQLTGAGELAVKIDTSVPEVTIWMAQATPIEIAPHIEISNTFIKAFPTIEKDHQKSLPIAIWSTGLKDLFLPIDSRKALNRLTVNMEALAKLSKAHDVVGVHAFAIEEGKVYARNFAPLYGIDEESATGTSNGALVAYLYQNLQDKAPLLAKDLQLPVYYKMDVLQGEAMSNTSLIQTKLFEDPNLSVWVGGNCYLIGERVLIESQADE